MFSYGCMYVGACMRVYMDVCGWVYQFVYMRESERERGGQCDQTTTLLFRYLAIYKNENYPNSTISLLKQVILLSKTKQNLYPLPKSFKTLPKWRNFTEYGHTGCGFGCGYSCVTSICEDDFALFEMHHCNIYNHNTCRRTLGETKSALFVRQTRPFCFKKQLQETAYKRACLPIMIFGRTSLEFGSKSDSVLFKAWSLQISYTFNKKDRLFGKVNF